MKKVLYTLAVNNYSPEICSITHPLMKHWADKIGAEFHIISERRWPEFAPVYEKLQIFYLAQENQADWHIFLDSDALVHPDTFDPTDHLSKDTVMHNWRDMAGNRWKYDKYFRRDGRHIGSGNWLAVASDWCIDLWRPPEDLSYLECLQNIQPTVFEQQATRLIDIPGKPGKKKRIPKSIIRREHLVDDYILSRNIAMFGLKFTTFTELLQQLRQPGAEYFWHDYLWTEKDKIAEMKKKLESWGMEIEPVKV
jgi:hypothetical protein